MAFIPKPVLTVDIVDFSLRFGEEQMEAVRVFIQMLHQAIPERHNHPSARIWSPAGDGGSITFWHSIQAALETAIALGRLANQYNAGAFVDEQGQTLPKPTRPLRLRIGLHSGPVSKEIDFDERENIWGDGINRSARVMSLAQPGQILASEDFYQDADLHASPGLEVTSIGKWWTKHHTPIVLYNIYARDEGVGIPYSQVEEWFGPFHYPLEQAISIYEAMAKEEVESGKAFRTAVLAKRLLDLNPQHKPAREIIESISSKRRRFRGGVGERILYDVFFSPLSPNALVHFFTSAQFKVFEKGQSIVRQGEKADSMMMVVSGEIHPFIGGERIRGRDKDLGSDVEIVLREGDIIGEMGLFNPGEVRTATLKASKRTITLSVDYRYLKPVEGSPDSVENKMRREIQDQIWRYYCDRTSANQINSHPLFRPLSPDKRLLLLQHDQFLPAYFQDDIQLDVEDIWDSWIIVVAGHVVVQGKNGDRRVDYGPGACLGPIRLVWSEELPYSNIEIAPNTHLIRFPWSIIRDLIKEHPEFDDVCTLEGSKDRRRFDLF